jgi:hypothetical protein
VRAGLLSGFGPRLFGGFPSKEGQGQYMVHILIDVIGDWECVSILRTSRCFLPSDGLENVKTE